MGSYELDCCSRVVHGMLVRVLKGHVLRGHKAYHQQHMPLGVVLPMTQ